MNSNPNPTPADPRGLSWRLIVLILIAIWLSFVLVSRPGKFEGLNNPGPGTSIGYDWPLQNLDAETVSFTDFQGKPLFVNIWATWCGPCIAEMPSIARLAATPELQGKVQFVCISTDESLDTLRTFLRGKNWPMTMLRAESLPPALLTEGIPATFLIGGDGKIVYSHLGKADWDAPEIVAKLRSMAEGSAAPTAPLTTSAAEAVR